MASSHESRLCEMLSILGGDEYDRGPEIARQRMRELAEWQQRARKAEAALSARGSVKPLLARLRESVAVLEAAAKAER